ncbi:MAG: PQQ-binding-like beta-propeller repeat protein [Bryobacteraceae bacterium]|nr:PQQ-binding-like beta-propeller repeat protein [Bryobacteraceae bacterium]
MRGIALGLFLSVAAGAGDWPQWRGPHANGVSEETGLAVEWSSSHNIVWRTPLPGLGTSTPIVWEGRVFVTSQVGDGPFEQRGRDFESAVDARSAGDSESVRFVVHAFSLEDGARLWEYAIDAEGDLPRVHRKHNLASPSCVTDGKLVYAWFGTGQLLALTLDGELAWKRHLGKEYGPYEILWGHGSSPMLYRDSLILLCDHPPKSYLLALDKSTGKELWKADRGAEKRSYTTPFLVSTPDGDQLIVNSSERIDALDPATGKLLWHVGEPNRVPVPTPVYHEGILYTSRGFNSGPYMAVKTGGSGDVSETRVEWQVKTGAPYVSSLLYYDGLLYMATETGIASAVEASTGRTLWRERFGGVFSASPVVAGGRIYLVNESGDAFVLEHGRELKVLSRNHLGERTLASPAVSGGLILLRTDEHVIAIGDRASVARKR